MSTNKLLMLKQRLGVVKYDNIVDLAWWNKIHETAKLYNVLIVFPVSDDLLYTAGYDRYDYPAWEGETLYVSDKGVTTNPKEIQGKLLLVVESVWLDNGISAWKLITTAKNYRSFEITEDGDVWANGLIIDMDAEMAMASDFDSADNVGMGASACASTEDSGTKCPGENKQHIDYDSLDGAATEPVSGLMDINGTKCGFEG